MKLKLKMKLVGRCRVTLVLFINGSFVCMALEVLVKRFRSHSVCVLLLSYLMLSTYLRASAF